MLGLRQKLLLGFTGLLAITVFVGAQSIHELAAQTPLLDAILNEDYQSVLACQTMKESLEQIDSGVQRLLLGEADFARQSIDEHRKSFESALERQRHNINLPGEDLKTDELETSYKELLAKLPDVTAPQKIDAQRRELYFKEVSPLAKRCIGKAEDILRLNQENMEDAARHVKQKADETVQRLYLLFGACGVAALGLVVFIGRWILRPIGLLTASAREVEAGNLDAAVNMPSHDEFSVLGQAFNAMAARLKDVRDGEAARLQRVERATQLAVDTLPDAVCLLNPEGVIEVVNNTAQRLFNLAPGVRADAEKPAWLKTLWRQIVAARGALVAPGFESSLQVFDRGEEKFFLPKAVPIVGKDGRLVGVTIVLADITDLRKLDELKSGLLSTTSHELKTPLTSLQMAVMLLRDRRAAIMDAKESELFESALGDLGRLRSLIDSILDLSRIEAGRVRMDMSPIAPRALVENALPGMRARLAELNQSIALEIGPDEAEVLADPRRIGLVFANLLSNASKYSPRGSCIAVAARHDDRFVYFSVCDCGVGISAEHHERVFEKFFRVPGQEIEGAGLGLAIAKEIVEAHGGSIVCESIPEKGSRFTFSLRRTPHDAALRGEALSLREAAG